MSRGVASSSLRRRSRRPGRTACPTLSLPSSGSTGPISNSPALSRGGIPLEVSPELRDAGERAFAVIRSAAERLVAQIPAAQRPPAFMVALHVWSLAHGIASLFGRGDAGRRQLPMPPEELLEAGVLVYLRGFGFPEGSAVSR